MAQKIPGEYQSDMEEMPEEGALAKVVSDGDSTLIKGADGSRTIEMDGDDDDEVTSTSNDQPGEFDDNLASKLTPSERMGLGMQLREYVEIDIQAREAWDRRLLDGMELIGLKDIPTDRVAFDGAAQVNHPGIAEAIVQFQARAVQELLPPAGPVKCAILGAVTDELTDQADRVEKYLNYQLTAEDDQYYWDTDNMLFYLPPA